MITTPAIKGTILPGITRKSIIDIARSLGFEVLIQFGYNYPGVFFLFVTQ